EFGSFLPERGDDMRFGHAQNIGRHRGFSLDRCYIIPSFSKDSLGRFVGFQRVTREKNQQDSFPNFFVPSASPAARTAGPARRRVGIVERHGETVAWVSLFRKRNRRCSLR